MSDSQPLPHIIAYDIGDKKRLSRIHRFLKKQAIPLQYSLFYARLNPDQRSQLIDQLDDLIVDSEDDVRIYPLPKKPAWLSCGKTLWPDHNFLGEGALPEPNQPLD